MSEGAPQTELQKQLSKRRLALDSAKGSLFQSEIDESAAPRADAVADEYQVGQFTPRSHRSNPSRGLASSPTRPERTSPTPRSHRSNPGRGLVSSPTRPDRTTPGRPDRTSPGRLERTSPTRPEMARDGTVLIAASNLENSVEIDAQSNASTLTAVSYGEAEAPGDASEQPPAWSACGSLAASARANLLMKDGNRNTLPAFCPAQARSARGAVVQDPNVSSFARLPRPHGAQNGDVNASTRSPRPHDAQNGDVNSFAGAQNGDMNSFALSPRPHSPQHNNVNAFAHSPRPHDAQNGDINSFTHSPRPCEVQNSDVNSFACSPRPCEAQNSDVNAFARSPRPQGACPRTADEDVQTLPPTDAFSDRPSAPSLQATNGSAIPFALPRLPDAPGPVPSDLEASTTASSGIRSQASQTLTPHTPGVPPGSVTFTPAPSPSKPAPASRRSASSPSKPATRRAGASKANARIWQAVVAGDLQTLEGLVRTGQLSSGRLLDHNGHSVFWDAMAFQQPDLALWLLRQFPPKDNSLGVDLGEVHARRHDSLLHLCLYLDHFTTGAAELFRVIFTGTDASRPPRELSNLSGLNFVHIAAARLNFWALRTALSFDSGIAALFHKPDVEGRTPLDTILRCAEESAGPMTRRPPAQLPNWPSHWSPLAQHVPQGSDSEPPPFADLVIEVEDPCAEGGVASVHVHRVVLSANSKAFDLAVRLMPPGETLRVDAQCCRSVEVLLAMLRFLYVGEVACQSFEGDAGMLWQLLCLCAHYDLPTPLTAYARTALLAALSASDHRQEELLPALLLMADQVKLMPIERSFTALALLAAPEALASVRGGDEAQARVLLAVLAEVERHVFTAQQG